MQYLIIRESLPWRCFPVDLDTSNFIEVTEFGRLWAKFIDRKTGETHDCLDYIDEALKPVE